MEGREVSLEGDGSETWDDAVEIQHAVKGYAIVV